MKVLLLDDEPAMHLILRKMLDKLPDIQVAGAFRDVSSAVAFLQENTDIALVFADISMQGENGLEFAAKLEAAKSPAQVVFVTSHKEFALEAYDLSVLDYLVKPVSQERLARTVNRALSYQQALKSASSPEPAAAEQPFVVTALGDVTVSQDSRRVKWISRKCTELFAYVLLNRGKRIPRSRLLADIFGDSEKSTGAVSYLNTTVYQLRKSLESIGIRDVIRSENDGYALEWKELVVDYLEFEREVQAFKAIDQGDIEKAKEVERRYTGELFGDKGYVWATSESERYAEMYASFVQRLAQSLIDHEETAAALKLLLKLNKLIPFEENVVRLLMMIREKQGDRQGLAAIYHDYATLLDQELSIRPSEELTQYFHAYMK